MTVDPERGFLSGNPATLLLFGCATEDDFALLSPAKISPETQPDGRRSDEKAAEMMNLAMQNGSHFFEWVHIRSNGEPFWAEILLTRVEIDGRAILQATVRNIDDRKRAEAEIHALNAELERNAAATKASFLETNNRLRLLIDGASDAVVTIDADGSVIDWNPAAEAIFGWTREEAFGQPMHMLVVPERMREAHKAGLKRFLATGEGRITHRAIEIKAIHKDGHEFDIELAIWPVKSGDSYTFSAFLRDISERKQNAELLEQRANRIRIQRDVLVRLASLDKSEFDPVLEEILRTSAATLRVERASFWMLSDDRSEIVCRRLFLQTPDTFSPEVLRLCSKDFPDYFEAIASRQSLAVEDATSHPATRAFTDGYLKPNNISALLDATVWIRGQPLGVVCHEHVGEPRIWQPEEIDFASSIATMISLASESSERIEAQRRLLDLQEHLRNTLAEREAVLENSGVGIALLRDSSFVWINQTLITMSGFTRDELVGSPPDFLYPQTPDDRWWDEANPRLSAGEPFRAERQFQTASGDSVWSRLSARCIEAAKPDLGSIWTIEDISERVRAEEEIRVALDKARELNDLKSRFVAMTSHEFRTPLSTILSSAELIQNYGQKMSSEECVELWKSIYGAVSRMTTMLDDVLVIGRSDAGEFDLKIAPLDLRNLCDSIAAEFRRSLPEQIRLEYSPPPPGSFSLDEKLLRHILVNLLSNAIKYSPAGGVVTFSVQTTPVECTFLISDQGIGIPQADIPRLFESFHRATNVGNISGTGLGLAIVKKSVERHSGTIQIDSSEGRGTAFQIQIPHGESHGENLDH